MNFFFYGSNYTFEDLYRDNFTYLRFWLYLWGSRPKKSSDCFRTITKQSYEGYLRAKKSPDLLTNDERQTRTSNAIVAGQDLRVFSQCSKLLTISVVLHNFRFIWPWDEIENPVYFKFTGTKDWNELPKEVRVDGLGSLKAKPLLKYLLELDKTQLKCSGTTVLFYGQSPGLLLSK